MNRQDETQLYGYGMCFETPQTMAERDEVIAKLAELLKVTVWRTDRTKHGNTEIQLRPIEP